MNPLTDKETLRVKRVIIRKLKKEHFKYHNHINLTEYVEAYPDTRHNHNGVAKDISKKMVESGKFICIEDRTPGKIIYYIDKAVKKDWKDRYWWAVLAIGAVIGVGLDIGRQELMKKIEPQETKSQLSTPTLADSVGNHKTHPYP
jgi:hypothetical protein